MSNINYTLFAINTSLIKVLMMQINLSFERDPLHKYGIPQLYMALIINVTEKYSTV